MSTVGNKDEAIIEVVGDVGQQLGGGDENDGGSLPISATQNNEDPLSTVDEKTVPPELDQSTKSDDVAAADPVSPPKPKRKTKGSTEQVPKPETLQPLATTQATNPIDGVKTDDVDPKQEEPQAETVILGPWDLKITNHGSETSCMVTRKSIPRGVATVLQYASLNEKHLAMGNFAQINALAGYKRFTFEG